MSHKPGDLFRHHKGADHRTDNWQEHRGRVDEDFLERAGWPRQAQPRIYVGGPTRFRRGGNRCFDRKRSAARHDQD